MLGKNFRLSLQIYICIVIFAKHFSTNLIMDVEIRYADIIAPYKYVIWLYVGYICNRLIIGHPCVD